MAMPVRSKTTGRFMKRRRNPARRRNVDGFVDRGGVFHPIRASRGYNAYKAGDAALSSAGSSKRGKRRKKRR